MNHIYPELKQQKDTQNWKNNNSPECAERMQVEQSPPAQLGCTLQQPLQISSISIVATTVIEDLHKNIRSEKERCLIYYNLYQFFQYATTEKMGLI